MARLPRHDNRQTIVAPTTDPDADFARTFLSSAFVMIFCALVALWSAGGLPVALLGAFALDRLIARKAKGRWSL